MGLSTLTPFCSAPTWVWGLELERHDLNVPTLNFQDHCALTASPPPSQTPQYSTLTLMDLGVVMLGADSRTFSPFLGVALML